MIDLHFDWWIPPLIGGLVLAIFLYIWRRILKELKTVSKLYEVLPEIAKLAEFVPTLAAMAEEFNTNGGSSLHETLLRMEKASKLQIRTILRITKEIKGLRGKLDELPSRR